MPMSSIYQMSRLADLPASHAVQYDCILLGSGSDARAYEVLRMAPEKGLGFHKVLLFDFEERKAASEQKIQDAYNRYSKLHRDITLLPCSLKDPSSGLKAIIGQGFLFNRQSRLAVDISAFTRPWFFSLLKYLQDHCGLCTVDVFYTEPMSYVLPKGLLQSYRASLGPLFVMEVPGFPGLYTAS
jgi:hypothetical protein